MAAWFFNQRSSGLHHLRSVYQQGAPSFLETGKSPMVSGSDCTEDVRRCPNGITHAARVVSTGQYADMHCHTTEQFHSKACLFGKITYDLIGLQKTNNTSHLTVGTAMTTSLSALTTWQCPTYNWIRQFFNITLSSRNQWSAATKQVCGLYAQTFFTFWMVFVVISETKLMCTCRRHGRRLTLDSNSYSHSPDHNETTTDLTLKTKLMCRPYTQETWKAITSFL